MIEIDNIYNMDCLEGMKQIPDRSVDLVVTDPPYWHKKSPGKPYSERRQYKTSSKFSNSKLYNYNGNMIKGMSDFNDKCINTFMSALAPKMRIMNAYIFCSETQVPYYAMWAENNKYMFSILVWEKPLSIINKNRFSQNLEYIVRVYDYGTALNRVPQNELYNRVRKEKPVKGADKIHLTQKPVSIVSGFLLLSSNEGDTILDPFMGSGTTAIACIKEKRHFIGFELNKEYFDKAQKRIKIEQQVQQTENDNEDIFEILLTHFLMFNQ